MMPVRFQVVYGGWVALALVLAAAALVLIWRNWRAWPGRGWPARTAPLLKLAGMALLLLMLLNPVLSEKSTRKGANDFLVLVDGGQSMEIHAGEELRAELEAAEGRPESWLNRLGEEFRVERFVVTDRMRKWPETGALRFEGQRSDLVHALEQVGERFARRPLAGVLLFTDGLATDAERLDLAKLGFRVFPVLCQTGKPIRDAGIRGVSVTASQFEDAPVTMSVSLHSEDLEGGKLKLSVRDERGEEMAREVHAVSGEVDEHVFEARFRPLRPGVTSYQVEATLEGGQEEATASNNAWTETVDRGRGPYRVLYLCGRPNWEHKFLSRALAPDPEIQLASLVRVAKREPKFVWRGRRGETGNPLFRGFQGQTSEEEPGHDQPVLIRLNMEDAEELRAGFPRDRAELFERYHAVVIDDLEADFFTAEQQSLLEAFVSVRGGSLLMLGGQESLDLGGYRRSTIGQMLPVYLDGGAAKDAPPGGARLDLTREGWLEPWVRLRRTEAEEETRLAHLPAFGSLHRLGAVKPGASILVTAAGEDEKKVPALVTQMYGEGRSAALLLGDVWRWGMESEAHREDMERWWRQVIRWLVADVPRFVEVETHWEDERLAIRAVQVRVRQKDFRPEENATVELLLRRTGEEGAEPVRLFAEPSLEEPGLYQAGIPVDRPGAYHLEARVTGEVGERMGQGEAGWSWNPSAAELAALQARPEFLEQLAAKTGGRLLGRNELDAFLGELPRMDMPVQETSIRPLWHRPSLLVLALGLFLGEWVLRRWKGGR